MRARNALRLVLLAVGGLAVVAVKRRLGRPPAERVVLHGRGDSTTVLPPGSDGGARLLALAAGLLRPRAELRRDAVLAELAAPIAGPYLTWAA